MRSEQSWRWAAGVGAAALSGLWVVIPRATGDLRGGGGVVGATTAAVFAVGCPICNKIVVGLLGVSGALGVWAPMQPVLAVFSLVALVAAVLLRWRRRSCTPEACDVPDQATLEAGPAGRTP